ncbi:MAG: flagellar hook-length control protein FliK [Alphaproteobacteria bacterium]|nr:flagellar hook-length control protein FliK [Alphaproteobacteria bacterium]
MNTEFFLNFTPIQKDLPKPANDISGQTSDAKKVYQTKKSAEAVAPQGANGSQSSQAKSFEDYIKETQKKTDAQTPSQTGTSEDSLPLTALRDLREALTELLKELTGQGDDAKDATQDSSSDQPASDNPLQALLALLAGSDSSASQNKDAQESLFTPIAQTPEDQAVFQNGLQALQDLLAKPEITDVLDITPEELQQLQDEIEQALKEDRTFDDTAVLNNILAHTAELLRQDRADVPDATADGEQDFGFVKEDRFEHRYDLGNSDRSLPPDEQSGYDFRALLKAAQAGQATSPQALHDSPAKSAEVTPASLFAFPDDGSLFSLPGPDGTLPVSGAVTGNSPAPLLNVSLTNPTAQAQGAAPAHPAVQTIAATIQKLGTEKQDTRITLQLDPPELGRVEVKMSLNKDNAAKVILTIEKPETYQMLQRDAHVLEQALHDSGLSADGSALEFSLANDGYAFGQNSGGNGNGSQGSGGSSGEDEQTVAVASPTGWLVDPETGEVRYNALI